MGKYRIKEVSTVADALKITDFLLHSDLFDDRLTPGDIYMMKNFPLRSITEANFQYWFAEDVNGKVIAINGVAENEQRTGGYRGDYLAVQRDYRKSGVAESLFNIMLDFIKEKKGRYLVIYTCDLEEYGPIRDFLEKKGLVQVGFYSDYYYEGESLVTYYIKFN